ncbi:MAG: endoribonuclease YbeY [Candidatus Kapaibacterium sp.]|nr:MAG: endoribonuclease YbeY [Candidatus Kapabacteria bacterium]
METRDFVLPDAVLVRGYNVHVDCVHDARWLPRTILRRAVETVLCGENVRDARIGIVLCDDTMIRMVNVRYLGHDWTTDVITFPLNTDPIEGEIYISVDTARRQAAEAGVSLRNELVRLVVHGVLHLLGYDDRTKAQRQQMHARQEKYVEHILHS